MDITKQEKNPATDLIEDFMIAANGVVAPMLEECLSPRIVKTPNVGIGSSNCCRTRRELPPNPDSKALNDFLLKRKAADPDHFADVSLAVIKPIGPGEYVLERPGDPSRATSVSRFRITRTPPLPIGDLRTSSHRG